MLLWKIFVLPHCWSSGGYLEKFGRGFQLVAETCTWANIPRSEQCCLFHEKLVNWYRSRKKNQVLLLQNAAFNASRRRFHNLKNKWNEYCGNSKTCLCEFITNSYDKAKNAIFVLSSREYREDPAKRYGTFLVRSWIQSVRGSSSIGCKAWASKRWLEGIFPHSDIVGWYFIRSKGWVCSMQPNQLYVSVKSTGLDVLVGIIKEL